MYSYSDYNAKQLLTYWFWASICGPYIGAGLWDIFNSIDRYSPTIYSYFDFEVIHFWRDIYWILVAKSLFLIWVWGQTILEILILGIKLWALLYLRSGTYSILLIHFCNNNNTFGETYFWLSSVVCSNLVIKPTIYSYSDYEAKQLHLYFRLCLLVRLKGIPYLGRVG